MLKETIDRLRFDLDELRSTKSSSVGGASGTASLAGTLSRSLANELKAQLHDGEGDRSREEEPAEEVEETERGSDDDYVETIIKRRKVRALRTLQGLWLICLLQKVARRTTPGPGPANEDVVKEYTDEATQHGPAQYAVSHEAQTDAPPPAPPTASTSAQTDTAPRPATPPPKREAPPPYHVLDEAERDAISHAVIERWHPGYAARGGGGGGVRVSAAAVREWASLKRELGFECAAIEEVVAAASPEGAETETGTDESVRSLAGKIVHRVVDTCHRRLGVMSPAMWTGLLAVLCAFGGVCLMSRACRPPPPCARRADASRSDHVEPAAPRVAQLRRAVVPRPHLVVVVQHARRAGARGHAPPLERLLGQRAVPLERPGQDHPARGRRQTAYRPDVTTTLSWIPDGEFTTSFFRSCECPE